MDIMTGENCRQFRLLTGTSFIGQFVHTVGGEAMGLRGWKGGIVILPSYVYNFIREHDRVV